LASPILFQNIVQLVYKRFDKGQGDRDEHMPVLYLGSTHLGPQPALYNIMIMPIAGEGPTWDEVRILPEKT
jgi:hypothetical protein